MVVKESFQLELYKVDCEDYERQHVEIIWGEILTNSGGVEINGPLVKRKDLQEEHIQQQETKMKGKHTDRNCQLFCRTENRKREERIHGCFPWRLLYSNVMKMSIKREMTYQNTQCLLTMKKK